MNKYYIIKSILGYESYWNSEKKSFGLLVEATYYKDELEAEKECVERASFEQPCHIMLNTDIENGLTFVLNEIHKN